MSTDPMKILIEKGQIVKEPMIRFLKIGTSPEFEEIMRWQVESGGKRIRPALALSFAKAIGKRDPQDPTIIVAAAGIELIHNMSLIYDDIIDQATTRRGKPTTRAEFGDEMAILAGIQHRECIYQAARETGSDYFPEVSRLFSEAISEVVEGERLDVLFEQKDRPFPYFTKHKYDLVVEEDYLQMINAKTASLIRAACAVGALVGGGTEKQIEAAGEFGTAIGHAFQIMDDYLDLFGDKKLGKEIGKDIIEQKLGNIVIIKALQNLSHEKQEVLLETMRSDLREEERVSKVMDLINQGNGRSLTRKSAQEFIDKAKKALEENFPDSDERRVLAKIADYVVSRLY
ncbi:MAG: polyprenyl synthetase family protein [Candidatus Bathyarchaeota archaeon]|nr:polyprenyl synthetase family protein [Candidatus Bathyarchaeota archaeon]